MEFEIDTNSNIPVYGIRATFQCLNINIKAINFQISLIKVKTI